MVKVPRCCGKKFEFVVPSWSRGSYREEVQTIVLIYHSLVLNVSLVVKRIVKSFVDYYLFYIINLLSSPPPFLLL